MWERLRQYWWILAFYGVVIAVIVIQERIKVTVDQNTIILLVIFLLPFAFSRLSSLEYGGFKLELRELRNEVVETKQEVRREFSEVREGYRNLSDRLAQLAERSADYLKPQPLQLSDEKAEQMRRTINLPDEEIELGLHSLDPNLRIPAYIELQVRPRKRFFHQILDSFWLEQLLARRQKETRPLWQLLVAVGSLLREFPDLSETDKGRARLMLQHTVEFLKSDDTVDPGKQCERRTELLLSELG
jgi:hypothetical protein